MSASNSLAGPLRRPSTRLLGVSLKTVSKAVAQRKKQMKMFVVMTPLDTEAASTLRKHATPGLHFQYEKASEKRDHRTFPFVHLN